MYKRYIFFDFNSYTKYCTCCIRTKCIFLIGTHNGIYKNQILLGYIPNISLLHIHRRNISYKNILPLINVISEGIFQCHAVLKEDYSIIYRCAMDHAIVGLVYVA